MFERTFLTLSLIVLLSACSAAPGSGPKPEITITPFCVIRVVGEQLVDPTGKRVVLHGVNLASISELEKAGVDPVARVTELAAAGAAVVRLAVVESELTPFYIPNKLAPVALRANESGLVLILSWQNDTQKKLSSQADDIEDFIRLASPALRGLNGIWFDPINNRLDQPPGKQRAVAERMINVLRGLGDDRIVVINHAEWLASDDVAINRPFEQANVLYGVSQVDALSAQNVPVFVSAARDAVVAEQAAAAAIGSASVDGAATPLWQRSMRCLRN